MTPTPTPGDPEARIRALEARLHQLETFVSQHLPRSGGRALTRRPAVLASRSAEAPRPQVTIGGYVETFYQYNFNAPSNGITNFRGFDNRHNSFTVENVVLDLTGTAGPLSARLTLQAGHTPESYYLAEPAFAGSASVGASNSTVWKLLQQAFVTWRTPLGAGFRIDGGLFLSPVGIESMAVGENWQWSRSNLFFGLPFYHTGVRLSYPVTSSLTLSLAGYNGWNSLTDNNAEKTLAVWLDYAPSDSLAVHALYMSGVERAPGAAERQNNTLPWRHLFDFYVRATPWAPFSFYVHANAGFEPTAFGLAWWTAGAASARLRARSWLYFAARADFFYESVPGNALGTASSIFWPSAWVASQTLTAELRLLDHVSLRLEYRHDHAAGDTYFRGSVSTDPTTGAYLPNARAQDTLTLGGVLWL